MPKKNGFECLTEIKTTDKLMDLPVVMFSTSYPRDAHYESDIIKTLVGIGAYDYLRKPSEFAELKQALQNILAKLEEAITDKAK
jgi:CheY-like chemotaxis protein